MIVYCKDIATYNYSCGAICRLLGLRTARPAAGSPNRDVYFKSSSSASFRRVITSMSKKYTLTTATFSKISKLFIHPLEHPFSPNDIDCNTNSYR